MEGASENERAVVPSLRSELFDIYKVYLGTADKISERRASANKWFLSVQSGLGGVYGAFSKLTDSQLYGRTGLWLLPTMGIVVSIAWLSAIGSYSSLNKAKFEVLKELEASLAFKPLTKEQTVYKGLGRVGFGKIERFVPVAFFILYAIVLIVGVL